jgi:hypothetical protein
MLKIALAASGLALAAPGHAATIIYTDEASFIAAAGGSAALEDFNDSALASPLTSIMSTNGSFQGNHYTDTLGGGAATSFAFSSAIDAFGGFFNLSPGGPGSGVALLLDGVTPLGTGVEIPNGSGADSFWGFVTDTPFTSVRLVEGSQLGNEPGERYDVDNLRFGLAAGAPVTPAIPEPASWALMVVGFGLLGGLLRRREKTDAPRLRLGY